MSVLFEFLKNNWFLILVSILLIPAYNGIRTAIEESIAKIPEKLHEQRMEEIRKENSLFLQKDEQKSARNLQVDNYYRTISGEKIEALFSEWMNLIADPANIVNLTSDKLTKMVKELMMYGSEETILLGAAFMQHTYKKIENQTANHSFELLYLCAKLAASLKKDFTGYLVIPEELLKMKIKDFSEIEIHTKFLQAKSTIDSSLNQ